MAEMPFESNSHSEFQITKDSSNRGGKLSFTEHKYLFCKIPSAYIFFSSCPPFHSNPHSKMEAAVIEFG